jgi:gamma-glutamylcysteine synthetase
MISAYTRYAKWFIFFLHCTSPTILSAFSITSVMHFP